MKMKEIPNPTDGEPEELKPFAEFMCRFWGAAVEGALNQLNKARHGEGCHCRSCLDKACKDMNSIVDLIAIDPTAYPHYRLTPDKSIEEYLPDKDDDGTKTNGK